ncbi:OmpA family protein [Vogesella mureinivorans]|jgi:outer membrane protein OmpA-like peptidoglycan-associated protein|uniref:OmpA family protein n=1 Tax=Vogesella mureinivorans TaxID=657276 RepID=UPI0011C72BBC|nr:OmpA family protein [Vogesella mureinivorans]
MKYSTLALVLCTGLLTACAANKTKMDATQQAAEAAKATASQQTQQTRDITGKVTETLGQATARIVEATGNTDVVSDPTLIPFSKMDAKLTPLTEQQVRALVPGLVIAKQVIVVGYCNRKEVGNAIAAAKARAEAVKKVLIENGISAKRIITQYDTTKPLHAVRVRFNG